MNRRAFLSFLAVGAAVSTVAPHAGFLETIRSYFFAPRAGWLCSPGSSVIYGGARGGGKILSLTELDELVQEYYAPSIVAMMNRDSRFVDMIRQEKLVGDIAGIPLIASPFVRPGELIMMPRRNWNQRERFPYTGELRTGVAK